MLMALAVLHCGKETPTPFPPAPGPTPGPEPRVQAELLIFSAPWCGPCATLNPQVHSKYEAAHLGDSAKVTIMVTTGAQNGTPPDQAAIDAYKHKFPLFDAKPDPWRFTTYKKYFGASNIAIPAAVLLPKAGPPVLFRPGSFSAQELIVALKEASQH